MFRTRLISGIVLIAAAIVTILMGGPVLLITLLILSLIGMFECSRALKEETGNTGAVGVAAYAGMVIYYLLLGLRAGEFALAAVLITLILCMSVYVFTWPRYNSRQVMSCLFSFLYTGVMLSHIYLTRILPGGKYTVWLIFICSWGSDTFAYCAGMLLGKHKMSPKLSPKKSVEGAVGGVLGAALLGAVYALVFGTKIAPGSMLPGRLALICAAGALLSMVGDLAASAIKREHGIKDYGRLIPGHGGILDRFDSVIFVSPVIWILATILL